MYISTEFKKAKINPYYSLNKNYENKYKTFIELSDIEKQSIADIFISKYIYCNCNEIVSFLLQSDNFIDSIYYDDLLSITNPVDYNATIENYLSNTSFIDLFDILDQYDICVNVDLILSCVDDLDYIKKLMKDKNIINVYDLIILIQKASTEYSTDKIKQLIIDQVDQETLCRDLDLNLEYLEVYEYYFVSDYFTKLIDNCANNILGQSIWGRNCTGQSICLDHDIQVTAFKLFSDLEYYLY